MFESDSERFIIFDLGKHLSIPIVVEVLLRHSTLTSFEAPKFSFAKNNFSYKSQLKQVIKK